MSAYPRETVGKQVRRADGTLMEEVITTTLVGNKASTSIAYRPVSHRAQAQVKKTEEAMDIEALLGEEGDKDEADTPPMKHVAPVAVKTGDNPTMDKLCILKQLLQEGILSQAEFDTLRKQVIDEMMAGGGMGKKANPSRVEGRKPRAG
jgi:hypothetical protein